MIMQNTMFKTSLLSLLALALAGMPVRLCAQTATTNKPAATTTAPAASQEVKKASKQTSGPFHGNLVAKDDVAKSITVGKRTFYVTSDTKIFKAGKPATLKDAVVGEAVGGGFKTADGGRLVLTKVTFGPKTETKTP
jgi:hypothetical protein